MFSEIFRAVQKLYRKLETRHGSREITPVPCYKDRSLVISRLPQNVDLRISNEKAGKFT
jgi:hypothetical protein